MMDAIMSAWIEAIGGSDIVYLLTSFIFLVVMLFVFYKLTN